MSGLHYFMEQRHSQLIITTLLMSRHGAFESIESVLDGNGYLRGSIERDRNRQRDSVHSG